MKPVGAGVTAHRRIPLWTNQTGFGRSVELQEQSGGTTTFGFLQIGETST
ncbi:MAG: hypothetical protein ACLVML_12460 [Candidatus Gastranaerophilaceae bacterium]|mgnify:FL=1|nr:hypothetical protein [Christensenellales bacterium]